MAQLIRHKMSLRVGVPGPTKMPCAALLFAYNLSAGDMGRHLPGGLASQPSWARKVHVQRKTLIQKLNYRVIDSWHEPLN